MADIDPDTPDQPVVVPASPVGTQAATLGRDLIILITAYPALKAVLGTHDLNKIVTYVTGDQFAQPLSIIALGATLLWRQWNARKQHSNAVKMATPLDNSIAIVKDK